jgi:hypothetical protein
VSVRAWIAVVRPPRERPTPFLEGPPFPPAAERCALTWELSIEAVPSTPVLPVTVLNMASQMRTIGDKNRTRNALFNHNAVDRQPVHQRETIDLPPLNLQASPSLAGRAITRGRHLGGCHVISGPRPRRVARRDEGGVR